MMIRGLKPVVFLSGKGTRCIVINLSQTPSFDPITDFPCQAKNLRFWELNHVDQNRPRSNLWASEGDQSHADEFPVAARLGDVLFAGGFCHNYKHIAFASAEETIKV